MNHPMPNYKDCIDACHACAVACNHCAAACLKEEDVRMMRLCIAQDIECAQVCELAAASMARNSPHAQAICQLCSVVCQTCALECRKHAHEHCQLCATACEQCALACNAASLQES